MEKAVNWGCVWTENDPTASPGRPDANWGYEVAQVNHYALRSPECFMLKRDRGDAVTVKDKLNVSYWKRWCRGGIEDRSILRHRDALLGEMAQLCEDPVLCSLDAAAKEVHQNRLRELLKQKEWRKLLAEVKVLRRPPPTPSLPWRKSRRPRCWDEEDLESFPRFEPLM